MHRHIGPIAAVFTLVCVVAPIGAQSAPGASSSKTSAVCKDGSMSSVAGRGACSGHGGVDSIATAAAKKSRKAAKADAKADKAIASKNPQKAASATALAKRADAKATKAEEKAAHDSAGATAQCQDGTFSHAASTKGACARHGGVAKTIKR